MDGEGLTEISPACQPAQLVEVVVNVTSSVRPGNPSPFSFDALAQLAGRFSTIDVPCPECSARCSTAANRRRKVMRIWRDDPAFISFHCARCGAKGYARNGDGTRSTVIDLNQHRQRRAEAEQRDAEHRKRQQEKARWLWRQSLPLEGTIAETYLRSRRGIGLDRWPATLRFLPPSKPEHHPAMIAPFVIPAEPEPGVLAIDAEAVRAVHLTLLKPDGSDKADIEPNKIIVGSVPGTPIVLAPMNDLLSLAITEGIEEGLTVHQAVGLGIWVAGAASRMPALADAVPSFTDCITIVMDDNEAGRRGAHGLAARLRSRGLHVRIRNSAGWEDHNKKRGIP